MVLEVHSLPGGEVIVVRVQKTLIGGIETTENRLSLAPSSALRCIFFRSNKRYPPHIHAFHASPSCNNVSWCSRIKERARLLPLGIRLFGRCLSKRPLRASGIEPLGLRSPLCRCMHIAQRFKHFARNVVDVHGLVTLRMTSFTLKCSSVRKTKNQTRVLRRK